jgi:hypothetical protein
MAYSWNKIISYGGLNYSRYSCIFSLKQARLSVQCKIFIKLTTGEFVNFILLEQQENYHFILCFSHI